MAQKNKDRATQYPLIIEDELSCSKGQTVPVPPGTLVTSITNLMMWNISAVFVIQNRYSEIANQDTIWKNDVRFVFTINCLQEGSCLIYVIFVCLRIVVHVQRIVLCFLFCFSCVPNVASFSGLYIHDSPFGFF